MGRYAAPVPENPDLIMQCDCKPCLRQVKYGIRLLIPRTIDGQPAPPFRAMTDQHVCEPHAPGIDASQFITATFKERAERAARLRDAGAKLDFEGARVDPVLVTTPEYRAFLTKIGATRVVA